MEKPYESTHSFLEREIPQVEIDHLNKIYGLELKPGAIFLEALDARAARLAETCPGWAGVVRMRELAQHERE